MPSAALLSVVPKLVSIEQACYIHIYHNKEVASLTNM